MLRLVIIACLAIAGMTYAPQASAIDPARPCGPDSMTGPLRLLIPQGVSGADFRPACRRHDDCYDTPGANKSACDRRYLQEMQCACNQSRHPILCRIVARLMYRATARHGADAFRSAQRIAKARISNP